MGLGGGAIFLGGAKNTRYPTRGRQLLLS